MRNRTFSFGFIVVLLLPLSTGLAQQRDTIPLSINDAVARAERLSEQVHAANAQIDVANAQIAIARSAGLPQIRLNSTENRTLQSARGQAVGAFFNQPYTYTATASLSQTLFQGGRVVAGSRAASALRGAAEFDAAETRAQLSLDVQSAYLQALYQARLVEIQQQSYDLAAVRVKQAEQFQSAGRFSRYDVLRARVEMANIEPALIQARGDVQLALLDLKRLIKLPSTQPLRLTSTIDSATLAAVLAAVDTSAVPAARPTLRAAELTAQARHLGVTVARADLLPTIAFTGQSGYAAFPLAGQGFPNRAGRLEKVNCPAGSDPSRVCTRQNGGWFSDRSVGLAISWPIFDGLRTKGAIDLAAAQARLADVQLADTRTQVETDMAKARTGLQRAQSLYSAQRQNVAEADEAFRLASLRYARGLSTQLEVSDAQLALTTAQTNAARSGYDLYLAVATLARTQGRTIPLPTQTNSRASTTP